MTCHPTFTAQVQPDAPKENLNSLFQEQHQCKALNVAFIPHTPLTHTQVGHCVNAHPQEKYPYSCWHEQVKEPIVQAKDVAQSIENLPNVLQTIGSISSITQTNWCSSIIPELGKWRQKNQELNTIFSYILSSRETWDI